MVPKNMALLVGCVLLGSAAVTTAIYADHVADTTGLTPRQRSDFEASRDERLQWWQEARFGVFLCWAPCSANKLGDAGWNIAWNRISWADYDALAKQFDPAEFDAEKVVLQMKRMGAKYFLFTTKHHAGFCMWHTKGTDYHIGNTPYGKDVCRQIADAAHKHDMRLGWYFSGWDWHRTEFRGKSKTAPNLNAERRGIKTEQGNPQWPSFLKYYELQVTELLSNYGKVDILWPDAGVESKPFYSIVRRLQPDIVLNNRWDDPEKLNRWDTFSCENYIPAKPIVDQDGRTVPWESCLRVAGGWYYVGPHCQPAEKIVRTIVNATGKNGNVVLSFPLNERGSFDDQFVEQMERVGKWFDKNGESIYGCGSAGLRSTYAWGGATAKPGHLYLHVFPENYERLNKRKPIVLSDFKNKVISAKLLAEDRPVLVKREGPDLVLTLPADVNLDSIATVIDVRIDGLPQFGEPKFIRNWTVLPIPGNRNPDLPYRWLELESRSDGLLDFAATPDAAQYGAMLAGVDVVSEEQRDTELLFGASDRGEIYLNGKRVFEIRGWERNPVPDAIRLPIHLSKGRNTLVVRLSPGHIDQQHGGWGFYGWIAGGETLTIERTQPKTFIGNQPNSWNAAEVVIEAESAKLRGATEIADKLRGPSGGKYVVLQTADPPTTNGLTAEFDCPRELIKPYMLLRYMCQRDNELMITIDGGKPLNVPMINTRGWHPYWRLLPVPLPKLGKGRHTLEVYATKETPLQLDAVLFCEGMLVGEGLWK